MQRFTISLDDTLAREFDRLIAARGVRHGHGHAPRGKTTLHSHLKPLT